MTDILLLKLKIFLNSVRHPERPLKKLFFSFLGIIFLAGIYFWLKRIFIYITNVPLIGEDILVRFLSLMIFISGGVAVLSSLLSAVSTMYTTEEMKYLISFPFSGSALFGAKALETALYANWMIFVGASPVALAWNSIYSMNFFQVFFVGSALFVFLMIMSSLGILLASGFALVFPGRKIRDGALVFFAVAFGGIFFYLKALEPEFIFHKDASVNFFRYLSHLRLPGTLLSPFQWVSRLFIAVSQKNYGDAGALFGVLLIIFLVLGAVCFAFGSGYFIRICGKIRASGSSGWIYKSNVPSRPASALKWREKTLFLRNSEQLSQVVILVVLAAIYLFSIYKAPLGDLPRVRELLTFLNIGGVGLILTASALRFVFTGVCLDGRFLWLLFSAPCHTGEILKCKMAVFTCPMLFAGFVLGILSGCSFRADFFVIILTSFISALIGFVVAQMAFYFAVSYPSYRTDNISQMESSYGGLVFMITGIFYVVSVLAVLAEPARWYLMGKIFNTGPPVGLTALFLFLFLLDSFVFSFFPGLLALRIFKSREHRNLVAART